MIDREKILKGLDCCSDLARCEECPYDQHALFIAECTSALAKDALELLKEHEAVEPIYNEEKYGDHLPHCGNCEKVLPNNAVYGKVNFCHCCGRAVKWDG